MKLIYGTIVLNKPMTGADGCVFPANETFKARCDERDRIFVESPKEKGVYYKVNQTTIEEANWIEEPATQSFTIKITGGGTRKDISKALKLIADEILTTPVEDLDGCEWEDSTLMTEISKEE